MTKTGFGTQLIDFKHSNWTALISLSNLIASEKNARSTHFALTSLLAFIYLFAEPLVQNQQNLLFKNPFYWILNTFIFFALGGPVFGWMSHVLNQKGFCNKRMFVGGLIFQVLAFSLIYYFRLNINWIWAMMGLGTFGILLPIFLYYGMNQKHQSQDQDPISQLFRYYYALILIGVFVVYLGSALKWVITLN